MQQGFVRIIAGKWRGRRLPVPAIEGLRPTPDRVRETLFNWLAPFIVDTVCLDLFAGTGALGMEALSRGAKKVVFVDQSPVVVQKLKDTLAMLQCADGEVYCKALPAPLAPAMTPFNLVFLDPPYQSDLLFKTTAFLEDNHYLAPGAYIYLEASALILDNQLPSSWHIIKSQKAGNVFYHLAKRE